ncbi:hypothetical protein XELAEV_18045580mg [Xenopus laevis]|uniref:Uncharacterized protein n=1 Tax=Xenopus laevis TaxID=8355 RepID=A0A974C138_XENLA|nr:hypothetical protein XELAEV_18045580mg [Xenopus laevis]
MKNLRCHFCMGRQKHKNSFILTDLVLSFPAGPRSPVVSTGFPPHRHCPQHSHSSRHCPSPALPSALPPSPAVATVFSPPRQCPQHSPLHQCPQHSPPPRQCPQLSPLPGSAHSILPSTSAHSIPPPPWQCPQHSPPPQQCPQHSPSWLCPQHPVFIDYIN